MDKKINLLKEIEEFYDKSIIGSIGLGCFGVIFTIGLMWGTIILHNENMFSAEPNLFGEIVVLITTIILAAASVGLFINAYGVLDVRNKFLQNENRGVLNIKDDKENRISNKHVLKTISYKDIVIRGKNIIVTDKYIVALGEEPYIGEFNDLEAVYRNVNDNKSLNILSGEVAITNGNIKEFNSDRKLKLVFADKREHIEILWKSENDLIECMKYFHNKGIKTYKGINSYYLGNQIEANDTENYLEKLKED